MKSELRRLFALAFPLALAEAGTQVMSVVDLAVVGRVGGRELAAVGLGNAVFSGVAVFGLGLMLGVDPLISQAVGAGDLARSRRIMWQGIWLAAITSAALTIVFLFGPLLLRAIRIAPEIVKPASIFLLIRVIGLTPWLMFFVVRAYLQAHHVTRPMVVSMITANVFNLIADIILVFGWGLSTAGSVRVGLAVGARDPIATRRAGHAAFIGAAVVMSIGALLFITIPSVLARMLTNQQAVIAAAIPLFFVAGLFQLSDGLQAAGIGALRGAADTRIAFFSNIVGYWLAGPPTFLFSGFHFEMGVVGVV